MARYRHYRNYGEDGETVFVTTTCLDFAHLLQRPEMKDRALHQVLQDCRKYKAALQAYVAMSNHIHLIYRVPTGRTSSWFMQCLKKNLALDLLPRLTGYEQNQLSMQRGLDSRRFWKRSFRSLLLTREATFWQKVNYIHFNPVKAGLVEQEADYRWSSARLYSEGRWDDTHGLLFDS